jgi:hypothetical protein
MIVSTQVWAQTEKPNRTFEMEIDPIAYLLKGYSFHGIYQPGRMRFDAGIFGIQIPESFHGNKGFAVLTQGFGLKAHYLVTGTRGLFTGIGIGYTSSRAKHQETGVTNTGHGLGIGPEIGYRFFVQKPKNGVIKGLYFSPWMSFGYNFITDKIQFQNFIYNQKKWEFFPTVHIGYRF